MKLRWKLLMVMLGISLAPMLLMRGYGEKSIRMLGDVLTSRIRDVLIQRATVELSMLVEEHARIMQLERALMESDLKTQAAQIERHLAGAPYPAAEAIGDSREDAAVWQLTVLENGTRILYPPSATLPPGYDALKEDWYRRTRHSRSVFWSPVVFDPAAKRFSFIVSAPLLDRDGAFVGATARVMPVSRLLHQDEHIRELSGNVRYWIVRPGYSQKRGAPALQVVAREEEVEPRHHDWKASETDAWLVADDPELNARLLQEIESRKSGVIEMAYEGRRQMAAYGSLDDSGSALMLMVDREDIVAESAEVDRFIKFLVSRQITVTSSILIVVFLGVIGLALLLSRSMTTKIRKLASAAHRIAKGDFKTRADIRSRDEIGELGRTFDQMIPVLEERLRIKEALDVAKEVQQGLLPRQMPRVEGLDIAARSIYCDETGGDFFDFMDFCCRDSHVTGVVVADVSGHGIPAALLMATVRAFLRSRVMQPGSVAEVVGDVNRLLVKDAGESGQFVTLFYAEIDSDAKRVEWVRAGHDPAFIYDPSSGSLQELWGQGIALGIEENTSYAASAASGLAQGQILVIGTDGVWESCNAAGEMFGKDRLMAQVRKHAQTSAQCILDSILLALDAFRGDVKREDDATLVVIKLGEVFGHA